MRRTQEVLTFAICVNLALFFLLPGCRTYETRHRNEPAGEDSHYTNPESTGPIEGTGISSQDIQSMTDRMMRKMLSESNVANRQNPPNIIIDSQYFSNESNQRINKNLFTEHLLVGLENAANGRMKFVSRQNAEMVEKERELKRDEQLTEGNSNQAAAPSGADYRLSGKIMSQVKVDAESGKRSEYFLITFKLVNLESGQLAWTGSHDFKKSAQKDIIYR